MGIFSKVFSLFKLSSKKKTEPISAEEEQLRIAFKARGDHFKTLLAANKRALEAMSTLEEAIRGDYFFSMSHIRACCTTISVNVYFMISELNKLTNNPLHKELFEKHKQISARIEEAIAPKIFPSGGPLVLPIKEIGFAHAHEVGDKMASLGEAWQKIGQPIPDGFVITASGFRHFLESNNLQDELYRRIQMADLADFDNLLDLSEKLQNLIISAVVPDDLALAIMKQYGLLVEQHGSVRLAVRSSAIGEDSPGVSFAGQYKTKLNVTSNNLLEMYKQVVASKYGVPAMSYRFNRGIPDDEVPMCVGCLCMVDVVSGGVVYSTDPVAEDPHITINSVFGLPKAVVDGTGAFDVFHVSREDTTQIIYEEIGEKTEELINSPKSGIIAEPLSPKEGKRSSLSYEQIKELADVALKFEDFYGMPQDIEWGYDAKGTFILLQSRPLQRIKHGAIKNIPLPANAKILADSGVCASSGVAFGKIYLVRRDEDMANFPDDAILLAEQAHSRWAPILAKALGVVTEVGGTAGHLASVAREYEIPALFGCTDAISLLDEGAEVTLDADAGRVFAGRVEEILSRKPKKDKLIFAGSPVYMALAKAMNHIAPLRLLYPEAPTFTPAFCETMHDITRFCHEKSVEEMFRMDENIFSGRCGKQLCYKGGKLQYFMVNLDAGFCSSVEGRYIELEKICSVPMLALWEGMIALPWPGPPAASVRGFLSVVAESAANPDLEITSSSLRMTRNYFMVDKEYCNLQASFGYHFCTVEAQAGPSEQENYVSFHFKGGAANMERKRRRVHVVADVLAENGFIVDVKEDALSARAEDLTAVEACSLLTVLGFLLIHTRQMDASLHGESEKTSFGDILRKGIADTVKKCTPIIEKICKKHYG